MIYTIMANAPTQNGAMTVALEAYGSELKARVAIQGIYYRINKLPNSDMAEHVSGQYILPDDGFWIVPFYGRKFCPKAKGQPCGFVNDYGEPKNGHFVEYDARLDKMAVKEEGTEKELVFGAESVFISPDHNKWYVHPAKLSDE